MDTDTTGSDDEFPWHLGVHDAHCHPTDTMSSIPSIPHMKAGVLTVMATRAEDQELVAKVANEYGVKCLPTTPAYLDGHIIPCFGWHPWFSHQMFDTDRWEGKVELTAEEKIEHYRMALSPKKDPLSDEDRKLFQAFPEPRPFKQFLEQTRLKLQEFPFALVGEVGIDRGFRIPEAWTADQQHGRDNGLTPGGREGRRLSPYHVDLEHQKKVLVAQLNLAGEMGRAVSCHGVQAHGMLFDTIKQTWAGYEKHVPSKRELKKQRKDTQNDNSKAESANHGESNATPNPYPPRICLHSYSGNASTIRPYWDPKIPVDFYASFSTAINFSERETAKRTSIEDVMRAVPDDRILVESDLHIAGDVMDQHLREIVKTICAVKGWQLHDGVKQLSQNWYNFVFGKEPNPDA